MDAEEGKARLMQGPAKRRRRAAVTALTRPGAPASAPAEQACAGERLNAPLGWYASVGAEGLDWFAGMGPAVTAAYRPVITDPDAARNVDPHSGGRRGATE